MLECQIQRRILVEFSDLLHLSYTLFSLCMLLLAEKYVIKIQRLKFQTWIFHHISFRREHPAIYPNAA